MPEQRFCDSCQYYEETSPAGDGHCGALGTETWYGEYACDEYVRVKEDE